MRPAKAIVRAFAGLALVGSLSVAAASQMSRPGQAPDFGAAERAWGRSRKAVALDMVRRLDMTSFANSTGPRGMPGKRTLADYGFVKVSGFDDGWADAAMRDGSWQVGVFVLDDHPKRKRLCITDTALGGGTYHSTQAIDVVPGGDGLWRATKVLGAVAGCHGISDRRPPLPPVQG